MNEKIYYQRKNILSTKKYITNEKIYYQGKNILLT